MRKYLYKKEKNYELYKGKMQDVLSIFNHNSIDCVITDPPYELNFMNKGWDNSGVAFQKETWEHCYKVLKEGGYLLAFGGSRTFHRIAVAIEDAGFEIRDCIMWLYGSGFPKSMNIGLAIDKANGVESQVVGKKPYTNDKNVMNISNYNGERVHLEIKIANNEWQGWGTCLKPAYEPIIVARKPFKGSLVDNVIENGVGGLNIDECRVETQDNLNGGGYNTNRTSKKDKNDDTSYFLPVMEKKFEQPIGRFPANVILTYDETDFEEVCGGMPDTKTGIVKVGNTNSNGLFGSGKTFIPNQINGGDSGSASRYFYCAKASKKDRDEGLDLFEEKQCGSLAGGDNQKETLDDVSSRFRTIKKNIHPTVKPVELMQYLVRLVTPKGGTILDCFMGSGSTGKAVMFENRERNANYKFIGVEMTEEYLPICESRIDYALNKYEYEEQKEKEQRKQNGTPNIFDYLEE